MKTNIILWALSVCCLVISKPTSTSGLTSVSYRELVRRHGDHSSHDEHDEHDHDHEELKCGSIEQEEDFNLASHIGSLFLVLAVSGLGCGFTGIAGKLGILKIPTLVINVLRHFGTGVIISTAFIHMLMASISSFMNPCAPLFTRRTYISIGPLIAMTAAFLVHLIETVILTRMRDVHKESATKEDFQIQGHEDHAHTHFPISEHHKVSTYVLELGILSHSVIIGIALGVASDSELWPLVIAICFHQFFEGLGLGARIAEILFSSLMKPTLMVLFYTLTTPIGILIGILARSTYSGNSPSGLVVQGTFDAISAGILIYTGLVELLGRELNVNSEFGNVTWPTRITYLFSVYLGAAAMAIIGIWA